MIPGNFKFAAQKIFHRNGEDVHSIELLPRLERGSKILSPAEFFEEMSNVDFAHLDESLINFAVEAISSGRLKRIALNVKDSDALVRFVYSEKLRRISHLITLELSECFDWQCGELKQLLERACLIGYRLSLDDFGSGMSNLQLALSPMIREVKFDRSLVKALMDGSDGLPLIKILDLMHTLSKSVVLEGIETEKQFLRVKSFRLPLLMQGYYLSKPELVS